MTNKVYSPQYVLWLLPFVVLARPRWRDWWVFTAGELFYFVAIWWHLGGELGPGDGGADRVYWLAVVVRLATEAWVVVVVVRDVLRPDQDPVRRPSTGSGPGRPDRRCPRRGARRPLAYAAGGPVGGAGVTVTGRGADDGRADPRGEPARRPGLAGQPRR